MQHKKVLVQVVSLQMMLLLLAACASLQPGPDPTPVPLTDTLTSPSPTEPPTSVPLTPIPAATPVPPAPTTALEPAPDSEATVSTSLPKPIVLRDGELQVTVADVANMGDRVDAADLVDLEIRDELRDTHYLLQLTVVLENIGYQNLLLDTRMSWVTLTDEQSHDLEGPLECAGDYVLCGAPMLLLSPTAPKQLHLYFSAPNEMETFTARISVPLFEPLKPEAG